MFLLKIILAQWMIYITETFSTKYKTEPTEQIIILALLFHYLMLNMFRMLIHPSSEACNLFVELFHGLYCCSGMMRVGVTVWFGCSGVVSGCRLKH